MHGLRRLSGATTRLLNGAGAPPLQRRFSTPKPADGPSERRTDSVGDGTHSASTGTAVSAPEQFKASTQSERSVASRPATSLRLNDGTRVNVRSIRPEDTEQLFGFFLGLAPQSYSARFPARSYNSEFGMIAAPSPLDLAAGLCVGRSGLTSLVALNEQGQIVALVDYSAATGLRSMIGLQTPRCEVNIVVADHLRDTGLAPKLLQEAMTSAKLEGYTEMVGYRQAGLTNVKHVLDLEKHLRRQHEHRPPADVPPVAQDWPPGA